jgi:hypothetical protein
MKPTFSCLLILFLAMSIKPFELSSQNFDSAQGKPILLDLALFSSNKNVTSAQLDSHELSRLKEGDFLLRKGYGWVSDRIADILDEDLRITHCGLLLSTGYEELHVLHCISNNKINGIFVESLSSYLKESQHGSLIAVRIKDTEKTAAMVLESKRLLAKKVPFDLAFNDADSSSFYCAELFAYVFKNIWGKDLLPEKFNIYGIRAIRMRNFLNEAVFDIIFNQFEY